jgi:hypothetical protein
MQKSLTSDTKLRLDGGVLLAGNDTTGEIGSAEEAPSLSAAHLS